MQKHVGLICIQLQVEIRSRYNLKSPVLLLVQHLLWQMKPATVPHILEPNTGININKFYLGVTTTYYSAREQFAKASSAINKLRYSQTSHLYLLVTSYE